jgi:hypothetical protein
MLNNTTDEKLLIRSTSTPIMSKMLFNRSQSLVKKLKKNNDKNANGTTNDLTQTTTKSTKYNMEELIEEENVNYLNINEIFTYNIPKEESIIENIKEKKKSIQFNIDPSLNEKKVKDPNKGKQTMRRLSVHERLNQLKVEAIKKRRLNNERKESLKSTKEKNQFFDFKNIYKNFDFLQLRLYYFLQRPTGIKGFIYRLFTFTIILGSIITGALTTIKSLDKWSFKALFWYEIFANLYFFIELSLRIWSCTHNTKYSGSNGRFIFLKKPLILIESFVIFASFSILFYINSTYNKVNDEFFKPITLLKFIQIFRFFYVDRKGQTWKLVIKTVSKHRFELLTSAYIGVIILLFSSYLILLVEKPYSEKNDDNHFHSYSDALYWSIITMATIGYGK